MKSKNIILAVSALAIVVIILYSFQGSQNDPAYTDEIEKEREDKDRFMKSSSESPFAKIKDQYTALNYFPIDPKYRIVADLIPIQNKKLVTLSTNDGKQERYQEYAYAEFDLDQYHNKLVIYEMIDMGPFRGKLFLAFGDATSANETYGAGRYLDIIKTPGTTTITLDFNKAYNPYCAYNETYSCPLPPPENLLNVAIRAGEKNYHE
jgi:uncharacterized protein (DUF1684 family)